MINKYRIFDKKYNYYVEEPDHRWTLSRKGILYNSENDQWYNIGERYIVEFSTGLFDAAKTEIFEGDKFNDEEYGDGYYLIEYDKELSKFCVNWYSHAMYFNEGGGEEFENEISLVEKNIFDVVDLTDDYIIGNVNIKSNL